MDVSRMILIIMPIFFAVVLAVLVNSQVNATAPIAVYDEGNNAGFIDYLNTISFYNVTVANSAAQLNDLVDSGKAAAGITIPAGFSDDLRNGARPTLGILINPGKSSSIFTQSYRDVIFTYTVPFTGQAYPVNFNYNMTGGNTAPNLLTRNIVIPIVILISVMVIGIMMLPNTLTTEKETRTLNAIMVTPTSENDVIYGKTLFGLLTTAVISILIIIGMVRFMSGGFAGVNLLTGIVFILLGSLAFVGLGLLIGSYANDHNTASGIAYIIMMPLMLLTIYVLMRRRNTA